MPLERRSVTTEEEKAADLLKDGMTIGVGGFITSSVPMVFVRQIIKRRLKDLTIISPFSSLELDMLIGAGCVKKVKTAYVGGEIYCPICPMYRRAAERGEIEIWEGDEAHVFMSLRAGAQRLPYLPWRGGVGTSIPEVNPEFKVYKDPVNGETLLAIPATRVDVAIIHAGYADAYGNVRHVGTGFGDRALERAADKTIVQVEQVVPNEEIRRNPLATSMHRVDAVIRAPYGAHPFASPGFYLEDAAHLREYVKAATAYAKSGDPETFDAYLQKYVLAPATHGDYLERIGMKHLINLYEY